MRLMKASQYNANCSNDLQHGGILVVQIHCQHTMSSTVYRNRCHETDSIADKAFYLDAAFIGSIHQTNNNYCLFYSG